ncbi:hypothetical protein [Wolbachia endosymbiont (group B) of Limnophora tigrina]
MLKHNVFDGIAERLDSSVSYLHDKVEYINAVSITIGCHPSS